MFAQEYEKAMCIEKLFQYDIQRANNEIPQLLSRNILFFVRNLSAEWFGDSKTYNFTYTAGRTRSQGVDLVLLSKAFNVAQVGNKVFLCVANITSPIFILRFTQHKFADEFYDLIENGLDGRIPCDSKNWISHTLFTLVNSSVH